MDPWGSFLAAAAFAICSTYHTTLKATPAQLIFSQDMILPIKIKANWAMIHQHRQEQMVKNNQKENCACIDHTYKVGDQVLLKKPGKIPKLDVSRTGPYTVTHVYSNGTVRIQKGAISECVNIRCISPFFSHPQSIREASAVDHVGHEPVQAMTQIN